MSQLELSKNQFKNLLMISFQLKEWESITSEFAASSLDKHSSNTSTIRLAGWFTEQQLSRCSFSAHAKWELHNLSHKQNVPVAEAGVFSIP